jgi:hypothetical protein
MQDPADIGRQVPIGPLQGEMHSDAPALAESVLGAINISDRLQPLLDREVGTILTGLLLEMKGSISCGGHMIMEFNNFEEVTLASEGTLVQSELGCVTLPGRGRIPCLHTSAASTQSPCPCCICC